jgi:hypothetical protein
LAAEAEVEGVVVAPHLAVVAGLPVRVHLAVGALAPVPLARHLAHLPLLQAVVVPLDLPVRAHLVLLVLLEVVVVLAVVAAPVQLLHLLSRPSFSAAMARSTP